MVGSITTCCVFISYSFIAVALVFGNQWYFTVDGLICHIHSLKDSENPWMQHNWKWLYRCFCSVVENVVMFTFCGMF